MSISRPEILGHLRWDIAGVGVGLISWPFSQNILKCKRVEALFGRSEYLPLIPVHHKLIKFHRKLLFKASEIQLRDFFFLLLSAECPRWADAQKMSFFSVVLMTKNLNCVPLLRCYNVMYRTDIWESETKNSVHPLFPFLFWGIQQLRGQDEGGGGQKCLFLSMLRV